MGRFVEQQSVGGSEIVGRPRNRDFCSARQRHARAGRYVDRATMFGRPDGSSVGGCAALHSRASGRTSRHLNTTAVAAARESAQPDVRADVRHAGGHGSTVRCASGRS